MDFLFVSIATSFYNAAKMKIVVMSIRDFVSIGVNHPARRSAAAIICSSYPIKEEQITGIRRICLQFDDIVISGSRNSFTENMAERIAAFVQQLSGYVKELYVVCDSGESRSAAIAAAILQSRGENEETIWKNPGYHPNRLVYERMCKAFGNPVSTERCHELMVMNEKALAERIEVNRKGI